MSAIFKEKPRILCVDDESLILEGMSLTLRQDFEVQVATSGIAALALLTQSPSVAVIVSDMRMPEMDGAIFLAQARKISPDSVRLLLTGQTEINSAIAAVNDGQIFRFLTKPCPPSGLIAAVSAALAQHRLITSERELLEKTLHGSIKALTDVLAMVNPIAFGRAARIKQLVSELADRLQLEDRWQLEVAAMLSQLGHITLPAATAEKVYYGRLLSLDEKAMVNRLPEVTQKLLGNIPRLGPVLDILRSYPMPSIGSAKQRGRSRDTGGVERGAALLRLAIDFDILESMAEAGDTSDAWIIERLKTRVGRYDVDSLEALDSIRQRTRQYRLRKLSARDLRVGMVLAEDVFTPQGILLVARGYQVTDRFLERVNAFDFAPGEHHKWAVSHSED